jgi:hypothetical protein
MTDQGAACDCGDPRLANRDASLLLIGIVAGIMICCYIYLSFACCRAGIDSMRNGRTWRFMGLWPLGPTRQTPPSPPPSPPPSSPQPSSLRALSTSVPEFVIVLHSDASMSIATAATGGERAGIGGGEPLNPTP